MLFCPRNVCIKLGYRKDLTLTIVIIRSLKQLQLLLFLSDIKCSKNALNVKAKVLKMKNLLISQTQSSSKLCQTSTKLAWASSIRAKHKTIGL